MCFDLLQSTLFTLLPMHDSAFFISPSQRISCVCMCVSLFIAVHCLLIVTRKRDFWDGDFEGKKRNGKKPNILCMYNMYRFFLSLWFVIPCARIYTLTTWKKTQFIHFNSCPVCLLVCGGFLYCWFVVIFGLCFSVCSDLIRTIPLRSVQFSSLRIGSV